MLMEKIFLRILMMIQKVVILTKMNLSDELDMDQNLI